MNFTWRRSGTFSADSEIHAVCRENADGCSVWLSGRITIDSTPGIQVLLLGRLDSPGCRALTVDLYEVVYIDTSGLAMLIELLRAARHRGKQLLLSGLRDKPRYVLETTKLMHLFHEADRDGQPALGSPCGGPA